MKKVILSDKIQLDKETISKLDENQLKEIEGGANEAVAVSCTGGIGSCFTSTGTDETVD